MIMIIVTCDDIPDINICTAFINRSSVYLQYQYQCQIYTLSIRSFKSGFLE